MISSPFYPIWVKLIILDLYGSCQEKEVNLLQVLSKRLYDLRKKQNWGQETAAKNFGIPFRTYRRYELGEREPHISSLVKIADVYQVSLDYLAGRTDDPRFEKGSG